MALREVVQPLRRRVRARAERRWGAKHVDALLAVLSAALALASLDGRISPLGIGDDDSPVPFRPVDAQGVVLVLAGSASLLMVRAHPVFAVVLVDSAFFAVHALGYAPPPLPVAELLVLYFVAIRFSTILSACAAGLTGLSIVAGQVLHYTSVDDDKLVAYLLALLAAWVVGYFVKVGMRQTEIAQENVRLLTEQQEARTLRAVRDEKDRISRELHDIVGHSVGVMVATASAASVVAHEQPDHARRALREIEGTGRAALAEMRDLMRELDEGAAARVPLFSADGLASLAEHIEGAGLPVEVTVDGTPRTLPAGVDLAAYRMVQESLTNSLKHSGAARATVRIRFEPTSVAVDVHDDGRARNGGVPGRGLRGMQQRSNLVGGDLVAGPVESGYRVSARFPVEDETP